MYLHMENIRNEDEREDIQQNCQENKQEEKHVEKHVEKQEEKEEEENKYVLDRTRKRIITNDNLKDMSRNMAKHAIGVTDLTEFSNNKLTHVCRFTKLRRTHDDLAYKFTWGYVIEPETAISKEDLEKIDYDNNLDSMIDYEKGFGTLLTYIIPLIECIRRHYKTKVVFCGYQETTTDVYLLF